MHLIRFATPDRVVTVLKPEASKITMKKVGPDKKIGPEKMKILTPCFDPLERRGIVDLGGVATGDGVQLVLERSVIIKKPFWT